MHETFTKPQMHKIIVFVSLFLISYRLEFLNLTPVLAAEAIEKQNVSIKEASKNTKTLTLAYFNSAVKGSIRYYSQLDHDSVQSAEEYPFDLYAITLNTADISNLKHQIELVRKSTKQFWPKIFLTHSLIKSSSSVLNVWDDELISVALNLLTVSLQLAVLSDADGIFLDLEAYNNRKNYSISYISQRTGRSEEEVIKGLKEFGQRLADNVQKQIKGMPFKVWLTFADFQRIMKDGYRRSTNYIVEGMLDRIVQNHYNITIIEGGEVSIGYVHLTSRNLDEKIRRHKHKLAPWVKKYAPHFILSGTMVLFKDYNDLGFWEKYIKNTKIGKKIHTAKAKDSREELLVMLQNYTYVWIYWGGNPIFDAFDPKSMKIFGPILEHALEGSTVSSK
jgi:hypothetical protein